MVGAWFCFRQVVFAIPLLAILAGSAKSGTRAECPGNFTLGYGRVFMVPTGWANGTVDKVSKVEVVNDKINTYLGSRWYFADRCTAGEYDYKQYRRVNLLGKTMRYSIDVSGLDCGCNAAFYLTSMGHNPNKSDCGDHYCDANNVCGESCAEIDLQEANQYAWHSTLHTWMDHGGLAKGTGGGGKHWNGPRDWTDEQYGPGAKCINTDKPFEVAVSFPLDSKWILAGMIITLSQIGSPCPLSINVDGYKGNKELTRALDEGMTPIVSYWNANDMLWLDGAGGDKRGPCKKDEPSKCAASWQIHDFRIENLNQWEASQAEHRIEAQRKATTMSIKTTSIKTTSIKTTSIKTTSIKTTSITTTSTTAPAAPLLARPLVLPSPPTLPALLTLAPLTMRPTTTSTTTTLFFPLPRGSAEMVMRKWGRTSSWLSKLFPGDWTAVMAAAGILAGGFVLAAAAGLMRRRRSMMPRQTSLSGIANAVLPQVDNSPISLQSPTPSRLLQSPISSCMSSRVAFTRTQTPRTFSSQGLMELGLETEAGVHDC
jgi:hypothetical protein